LRLLTCAWIVLWTAVLVALNPQGAVQGASHQQSGQLVGTWRLVSRSSTLADGTQKEDPKLGAMPMGYLAYDASGHVSAQLMKRDRVIDEMETCGVPSTAGQNNSTTVCGYDAYAGTYTVEGDSTVVHHLEMAISPADVGKVIRRSFRVDGDKLTISFATTSSDAKPITRNVVWERVR
jgi:hypothetical protein